MNLALSENKKPRLRNRGLSCGPIRANGSNQVDLSLLTDIPVKCYVFAKRNTFLHASSLKVDFPNCIISIVKVSAKVEKTNEIKMNWNDNGQTRGEINSLYCHQNSLKGSYIRGIFIDY
jgi:hypothetical protein